MCRSPCSGLWHEALRLMPFGSNVRTVTLAEPWSPTIQNPKVRTVKVPEAEAPWWWSQYLTEEWKRRNHYNQKPRDGRSGLQKAEDEWNVANLRWSVEDPHYIGLPPHAIWGTTS